MLGNIFSYFKSKLLSVFLLKSKNKKVTNNKIVDNEASLLEQVNYFYDDSEDLYYREVTHLHI